MRLTHILFLLAGVAASSLVAQSAHADDIFADLSNSVARQGVLAVHGRLMWEDEKGVNILETSGLSQVVQDEAKKVTCTLHLYKPGATPSTPIGEVTSSKDGELNHVLSVHAHEPGLYDVGVRCDGSKKDSGKFTVRWLPTTYDGLVVRSDLDMTYLLTQFEEGSALANLVMTDATEREALPGMAEVYKGLRRAREGLGTPLVFLSGSPRFFKRVIEGKLKLDGVKHDGLVLKPFKQIIRRRLRLRRPGSLVPSLKEQIGFKLHALIEGRMHLPRGAQELLLGDDTEADIAVYGIYYRFLHGELSVKELMAHLKGLGVSWYWRGKVFAKARRLTTHSKPRIVAIYINLTGDPKPVSFDPNDYVINGITHRHAGAMPLADHLRRSGLLKPEDVGRIEAAVMKAKGKE